MLTALFRSYRDKPAPQLRLRMAAFAALGAFGVAALVLYWLLHIYWYDAVYQFGVLLFIILLLYGLIGQAAGDMRFHMEHRISHEMQREDRMTGLPNRRAFEEYMERIRTGKAGCRDAVLTYIRLEGLNERNDRFGLQAGDESVIAAAQCVADFCRACEEAGESVLCFRTGGNEFALIRPEPHTDSGQLHRQFRAVVARYNRTCAPRARIIMTFGFSRDDAGKFLGAYYDKKIYENDPFAKLDQVGVGKLVKMAAKMGRETRPDLHLGICGEHGGDPSSVEFCHKVGLDYVSCSPFRVPIARLAAAQAAIREQRQ